MIEHGWSPHETVGDPVVWHRRDYNKIADYLANHTMDRQEDWSHVFAIEDADFHISEANMICHSDGGTRDNS